MSAQISRVPSVAAFNSFIGEVLAVFALATTNVRLVFKTLLVLYLTRIEFLSPVDVAIAVILVWYLQQGKTSFDRTSFVVARVVQYTVATGLATSLLAVASLIALTARALTERRTSGAWTNLLQAMHFSLGRMYTNALLATLNSRRNLRKVLDDFGTVGPHTGSSFLGGLQVTDNQEGSALTQRSRKDVTLLPINLSWNQLIARPVR
ncbi:hypothetical protein C8F04DRAFT_1325702 [Mycena alexandri]|uniref:DUF6534 domain-containing protein n=1 Tax=Mycena alexandri TaxID=1745969 RepID=A0AAD6S2G4_9AGAR|nr:hypothetical protein C8F04DRAFT_1325702 [Mycena alexandri]